MIGMCGVALRGIAPAEPRVVADLDCTPEGTESGAHVERERVRVIEVQVCTQNRRIGRDQARAIARFISQRPAPDADESRRQAEEAELAFVRDHGNRARAALLPRSPAIRRIHLDLADRGRSRASAASVIASRENQSQSSPVRRNSCAKPVEVRLLHVPQRQPRVPLAPAVAPGALNISSEVTIAAILPAARPE